MSTIFKRARSHYDTKNMPRLEKGCLQELYSETVSAEFRTTKCRKHSYGLMCVKRVEEKECESQMANSRSNNPESSAAMKEKRDKGLPF